MKNRKALRLVSTLGTPNKGDDICSTGHWSGLQLSATLQRLLFLLAAALMIREFVWSPVLISGNSMLPLLHGGQISAVNKLAYWHHSPQRGDIVVVRTDKELMVKRIVGLPGEEVEAHNGLFSINGLTLQEPYVQFRDTWSIAPGKIAPDQFVIVGDNRSQTVVAVIAKERIVGRLCNR